MWSTRFTRFDILETNRVHPSLKNIYSFEWNFELRIYILHRLSQTVETLIAMINTS